MDYQEHRVPENLRRHIVCVWRLIDGNPRAGVNTIYPDGRCELIAQLGGRSRLWDALDGWHEQAPTLFAAQRVTAVQFEPRGVLDDVGIRLQPAASTLVTRKLAPLRDRVVDLASIDVETSAALAPAAREFAAGRPGPLWELLARLCSLNTIDAKVESAAAQLDADGGQTKIDALAKAASLSVRSLQTRFLAGVGLTPKEFAGIQRLQATLRALDGETPLADLANESGFSRRTPRARSNVSPASRLHGCVTS